MEKFKCPNCDYVADAAGTCPTHGVALVKQEAQPVVAPDAPAAAQPTAAPDDGAVASS